MRQLMLQSFQLMSYFPVDVGPTVPKIGLARGVTAQDVAPIDSWPPVA